VLGTGNYACSNKDTLSHTTTSTRFLDHLTLYLSFLFGTFFSLVSFV